MRKERDGRTEQDEIKQSQSGESPFVKGGDGRKVTEQDEIKQSRPQTEIHV